MAPVLVMVRSQARATVSGGNPISVQAARYLRSPAAAFRPVIPTAASSSPSWDR